MKSYLIVGSNFVLTFVQIYCSCNECNVSVIYLIAVWHFTRLGNPEPKIIWKKNDKEIKPQKKDKRFKISWDIDADFNTLEIKDATIEDAGIYTVEATNSLGTVQSTVTVTIQPTEEVEVKPINEAVCIEETTPQETAAKQTSDSDSEDTTSAVDESIVEPEILIKPEDVEVTLSGIIKLACRVKG